VAFRGLFIGIDRYESPDIDELSCARRDAVALEALFADTLGGTTVLLTDQDATRERIAGEFAELENCDAADTVVISYSGHGSETHELVTHDTDFYNIAATAIPLEAVQEWFSRIPAKRLIFFLDCCFAGGIGAKVIRVVAKPRDLRSTEARLAQLAGDGRIIFTASTATESAWEYVRYGHGLLTYFLIEALRGPAELIDVDRLSLYRLLDYVTGRVKATAYLIGQSQNPTMRGQIDGELIWPVFVPGERFMRAFPNHAPEKVTADLASLSAFGFPDELIAAWGQAIPSLNVLQIEAINDYVGRPSPRRVGTYFVRQDDDWRACGASPCARPEARGLPSPAQGTRSGQAPTLRSRLWLIRSSHHRGDRRDGRHYAVDPWALRHRTSHL
jgi:helicase